MERLPLLKKKVKKISLYCILPLLYKKCVHNRKTTIGGAGFRNSTTETRMETLLEVVVLKPSPSALLLQDGELGARQ